MELLKYRLPKVTNVFVSRDRKEVLKKWKRHVFEQESSGKIEIRTPPKSTSNSFELTQP
jgi:hypothetical protein